ncbi:MAG: transaldolase, partial [Chloroflexi bacterium]|nr:transaldolase [Chloroflexota bacterium]
VLLDRALTMACNCAGCNCPVRGDNSGAWLGAIVGDLAAAGRDKLTLITSPLLVPFGVWVEQLVAESTGKEGKGILPVVDEPLGAPAVYGDDRLFVYLRLAGDATHDAAVQALVTAGQPVVPINLRAAYDLGGEFLRWEIATAVAGRRLGINPFDQPNVESAKVLTRQMLAAYQQTGALPALAPTIDADGIRVYGDIAARGPGEELNTFLSQHGAGDYLTLQAYLEPAEATTAALQALRTLLRDRLRLATTVGYGPRFLHSTGQLHKGDAGNGLFIQITADDPHDVAIPDEAGQPASSSTFGVLKAAQALGDRQALLDAGRRVIRFHLGRDVVSGLKRLREALA